MAKMLKYLKFGVPCAVVWILLLKFLIPEGVFYRTRNLSSDLMSLRKYGITNNLVAIDLESMNTNQLLLTLHSYLDNIDVVCQRKIRMGNIEDGGWEICDDPDVRPKSPCLIYSFGINYDFSFDDDAARLYGCHVFSFDPSMSRLDTSNRSDLVHFYRIGLGDRSIKSVKGWNLYTLKDIRARLNHQNAVINIIKMDIEDSEWEAIPEMVTSNQLADIQQLLLEYHVRGTERNYVLPRLKIIQAIEKLGFKKFYVHKNYYCETLLPQFPVPRTECYEVHYLRRNV